MTGGVYHNYYNNRRPYNYQPPYPYQYNNYNYNRPYLAERMIRPEYKIETTQLAYVITIYMELYPGTSIPSEEVKVLKCRQSGTA